jgi:hypothetical protein
MAGVSIWLGKFRALWVLNRAQKLWQCGLTLLSSRIAFNHHLIASISGLLPVGKLYYCGIILDVNQFVRIRRRIDIWPKEELSGLFDPKLDWF